MVALLKENGEFVPMPVVYDTGMLKQLVDSMEAKPVAHKGLADAIRAAKVKYVVVSK